MDLPGFPEAFVSLFLLSACGWGRLCRAFCDRRVFRYYSLTTILGLAALNAIGGLLNLLKWATTPVLFLLLLIGAAIAGVDLLKRCPWRAGFRRRANDHKRLAGLAKTFLPWLLVLTAGIGACLVLVPTTVFNFRDDLNTYVPRAVRMVQTGSVGGNAFDASGLDSLGSQSFFHGFFLSGQDIRWLNAFDAVACFALCLLLAAELVLRWRLPWFVGVLTVICVMVINPQCVNISPLYSGAALIASLILCGGFLERAWKTGKTRRGFRPEITLALICSALATLKVTLAFFAAGYLLLLYPFILARTRACRPAHRCRSSLGFPVLG